MGAQVDNCVTSCLISKFKSLAMAMKAAMKATKAMKAMKAKKAAEGDAAPKKAMKAMKAMKATKRKRTAAESTSGMACSQNFGESTHNRVIPIDSIDLAACMYFSGYTSLVKSCQEDLMRRLLSKK